MPKFAANLTMLFNEVPFLDRFALARQAGFDAVEFLFPYSFPAERIKSLLVDNHLKLVLHNLPAGNWDAGERGIACHPDRTAEFRAGVMRAIEYAKVLGVEQLNCLVGRAPADIGDAVLRKTLVANLRYAAEQLKAADLKLLLEPINIFDIPGFYLNKSAQTIDVIEELGVDNAYLQYDIYHMQRMEGELASTLQKLLPRIAHIQLADNPGRNEPGTGEINYKFLFEHLDRLGYDGWIGCEYKPAATTQTGLTWVQRLVA